MVQHAAGVETLALRGRPLGPGGCCSWGSERLTREIGVSRAPLRQHARRRRRDLDVGGRRLVEPQRAAEQLRARGGRGGDVGEEAAGEVENGAGAPAARCY